MKIQLSQTRMIPGYVTVWSEHGPEVDIVMDLKNLTFRHGIAEEIVAFHVLDHLFPEEVAQALANWKKCLIEKGRLVNVVDDFEYIARGYLGGDFSMELFNAEHAHPTQFSQHYLANQLYKAGFKETDVAVWFNDVAGLCPKKHYELVLSTVNS